MRRFRLHGFGFSKVAFGLALTAVGCGGSASESDGTSTAAESGGAVGQSGSGATQGGSGAGTAGGSVLPGCASGMTDCNGTCRNLDTDVANCGACGTACTGSQACVQGECSCLSGGEVCGGTCVDTQSNPDHCGECDHSCNGAVCSEGTCQGSCASHLTLCNSACVDTNGSSKHCGECGNECPEGQTCDGGMCRCPIGQEYCGGVCQDATADTIVCDGQCKDSSSDAENCGSCGNTCAAGTQCVFGGCIDPSSVTCTGGGGSNEICNANEQIMMGRYWLNNNFWGTGNNVSGSQCSSATCQTGDLVGWTTDFNWNGRGGVVTFVSLVFGWHWGWEVQDTGLPVQISSGQSIGCGWDFSVNAGNATLNVAYDMWTHTLSNPGSGDDPADEVMVWLYRSGGAGPIGSRQDTVDIGGSSWDLHRGDGGASWEVFSFVRTQNAETSVLNMMDFFQELVSRGWMQSNKYVSSIEAGAEISNGQGTVTTNGFYCRL